MSVAFARAVMDGLRRHGIAVHEHPGWDRRGNGQSSAYVGMVNHHTAAAFDGGLSVLVNGRSDLPGPLCNMAGKADGSVILVAAHPANHAGAGAGRSMGPLPRTGTFNKHVWGLEIMYPGTQPMTPAQMRTAQIMSGVVCGILKRPNPEWARAHAETSSTGKWDPGYASGKTIDMAAFRRGIWGALHSGGAPAPAGRTHTVAKGQTLAAIGRIYGVPWQAIAAHNGLANPDAIREGQVLRIPDTTPAPPPAPAPVKSAADVLRANGIVADPADVIAAAQAGGLEVAVMAAMLQKESYGGRNVFGNDNVAYPSSGPYTAATVDVTHEASQAYLRWRGPAPGAGSSGRQNGVGPGQLTWFSYQDDAEARGGLHVPRINMTVGAETLAGHVRAANGDIAEAGARYNGGANWRGAPPAKRDQAEKYGRDLRDRGDVLRRALAGTTTGDDDMTPDQERLLREVHHQLLNKWPGWRWVGEGEQQPAATIADYVRGLDQIVASRYTLASRPLDSTVSDTSTGQLLSLRAEVRALADRLDGLVQGGPGP